jgi:hypothetical protein
MKTAFGPTARTLRTLRHHATAPDEYLRTTGSHTAGAVRVSFGVASNIQDTEHFLAFAEHTYRDRRPDTTQLPPRSQC